MDAPYLSKLTTGKRTVGVEKLYDVGIAYPGLSLDWLILGQGEMLRTDSFYGVPMPTFPPAATPDNFSERVGEPDAGYNATGHMGELRALRDLRDCMKEKETLVKENSALRLSLHDCEQRHIKGSANSTDSQEWSSNEVKQPEPVTNP